MLFNISAISFLCSFNGVDLEVQLKLLHSFKPQVIQLLLKFHKQTYAKNVYTLFFHKLYKLENRFFHVKFMVFLSISESCILPFLIYPIFRALQQVDIVCASSQILIS